METARKIERMDCPTCGKRLFDKEDTNGNLRIPNSVHKRFLSYEH
jgi:hypothetical protein